MTKVAKLDHRELLEQAASLLSDHPLIACGLRGIAAELDRPSSDPDAVRALEKLASISLWQDRYPDGPDILSDSSLNRYFTPADVRKARAAVDASRCSSPAETERLRPLVDWTFLYATEGDSWPGQVCIDHLIRLSERAPTQADADGFKSGALLKTLTEKRPPSNQEGGK